MPAIVSLTSDFGLSDPYVVLLRMPLLLHDCKIVDISHQIEKFNIAHAAFVIKSTYRHFPEGTIHIIAVGEAEETLLFSHQGHYFICPDNGLPGLICDDAPAWVRSVPSDQIQADRASLLSATAALLLSGANPESIGTLSDNYQRRYFREASFSTERIKGHVIRVDDYGNLISNISHSLFEAVGHGRKFQIEFAREKIRKTVSQYQDAEAGDCLVRFNELGLLEIAIREGSAAQLLGLGFDSPVSVQFL